MRVSILIPCYNAERWIGQSIQSALDQTWPDKEVIVLDDGSTDRSLQIIQSFGDRIVWETSPNRGGNAARNRLLELARGPWLQYLDADDYLSPDKIKSQAPFIETHPDTDVLFGPVTLEHVGENETHREPLPIPEPHDPWILLARWYLPQTGAPLWRKQAVLDVGAWKPNQPCCQEHELYLRLLMAGKHFQYCPSNGAIYRQWSDQTVCRRDWQLVAHHRLQVLQRLSEYLEAKNELTDLRLQAVNETRFEIARQLWLRDRAAALSLMAVIRASQPGFLPQGRAARRLYRMIFALAGFEAAEYIAWLVRMAGKRWRRQ